LTGETPVSGVSRTHIFNAMRTYRITRPPRGIRRAQLDNLALVPANLLPYKEEYQHLANDLPQGDILIILPEEDQKLRIAVEKVAHHLKAAGQRVTTLPANLLLVSPPEHPFAHCEPLAEVSGQKDIADEDWDEIPF
jgi:hypothetical protein